MQDIARLSTGDCAGFAEVSVSAVGAETALDFGAVTLYANAVPRGLLLLLSLLLSACVALPDFTSGIQSKPVCEAPEGVRAFGASNIGEQWIDYVWVEVPFDFAASGRSAQGDSLANGRLFVASADPRGAIVPTMVDLICANGAVDYAPASVEFEVDESGTIRTSYGWKNCAACSECYMQWTFRLDLEGQLEGDALAAQMVLNETFHSGPMKIVSVKMEDVSAACTEPHVRCTPEGDCGEIKSVERR